MTNPNDPWAIPPMDLSARDDPSDIFEAVGIALSQWEHAEAHMALLFGHMIGADGSEAAQRAYGSLMAFGARQGLLKHSAEVYFRDRPNEALEARFNEALRLMGRASARRNEIAHGVMQPYQTGEGGDWAQLFYLVPSYYIASKRTLDRTPAYAYSAPQIRAFATGFETIGEAILDVLLEVVGGGRIRQPA